MARWVQLIVFLTILSLLSIGLHYYIWYRLAKTPGLPAPWRTIIGWTLLVLGASIPLSFLAGRVLEQDWAKGWTFVAYIWMGFVFLFFAFLAFMEGPRLVVWIATKIPNAPIDESRRLFLSRLFSAISGVTALGAGALAVAKGLSLARVRTVEVPLKRLPAKLDKTVIVQMSDIHIGPTLGRTYLEQLVRETNALSPDVVAITGDLVDGSTEELGHAVSALEQLKAKHGVYFVTGNHEYYSGAEQWVNFLRGLGVRVLRNERVSIGDDEFNFDLAGIDDWTAARHDPNHGPDLAKALEGRDESKELVLLAHQPRAVHEAEKYHVGLLLSGHTHGGQLWPFGFIVKLVQPVLAGLAKFGSTYIYVNSGTGFWGPPMRLGTTNEITKIVLRSV